MISDYLALRYRSIAPGAPVTSLRDFPQPRPANLGKVSGYISHDRLPTRHAPRYQAMKTVEMHQA